MKGISLFSMSRVSREKLVFFVTVAVIALLGVSLAGSIVEVKEDAPRPRKVEFEEPVARPAWFVASADEVYRAEARDPFREPREIEDLAPLDLPLPPPPSLPLVAPPAWTDLEPKALALLRRPFDVKESAPAPAAAEGDDDDDGVGKEGEAPPAPASGDASGVDGAPVAAAPPRRAAPPAKKAPVEETYDTVVLKGGKQLRGRIQVEDPLDLLGEEIDAREDRFSPKPGSRFKMVVHDESTGKSLGSTEYEAAQVDSIQPARSVETRARLQTRRFTASDVRGRLALGRYCLERGALAPARAAFESALAIEPGNADAVLGVGSALRAAFDWDSEMELYRKALESGVASAGVRARKAEIEALFGLEAEAEGTLREGLANAPGDATLALELGSLLARRRGTRDEGLALLKRAADGAANTTDRARALEAAAEAYLRRGDLAEAKDRVAKARESSPERGTGAALAGAAAYLEGNAKDARASFESARAGADVDPGAAAYGSGLADVFLGATPSAADAALARAEAEWPLRAAYPLSARAYVALRDGRLDAAQDFLEAAVEADPAFPYPRYVLGRLYAHAGDAEKAEASLRAALDAEPGFADALGELSLVSLASDDTEAGIRFANRALEIEPGRADIRTVLALHLLRARNGDAARAELKKVIDAGEEGTAPALNALAALTYREGGAADRLQALDYFQRVIEAASENEGGGGEGGPSAADLAYAKDYLAAIRDNVSKVQWVDGFNRTDLKRGWTVEERYGVDVKLESGVLRFAGRQTQEDKVTTVLQEFPHGRFVSFEVTLNVPKGANARVGILLASYRQDDLYAGVECARDPKGGLSVRTTRAGKAGEWATVEGFAFPDGENTVVALELVDLKQGLYSLRVGGQVAVPEIKVESLRGMAGPVKLGVFGAARIGAEYAFTADDVRVVLKKE